MVPESDWRRSDRLKIAVLTAGGVAPGMNAAVRAVAQAAFYRGWEVVGVEDGFEGILEERLHPVDRSQLGGLMHRGGTVLGTGRSKEVRKPEGQERAARELNKAKGPTRPGLQSRLAAAEVLAGRRAHRRGSGLIPSVHHNFTTKHYQVRRQFEWFKTAAKVVHSRYGNRSNAALLEILRNATIVSVMATQRNKISTRAQPGALRPKNTYDHSAFSASCVPNRTREACQTLSSCSVRRWEAK